MTPLTDRPVPQQDVPGGVSVTTTGTPGWDARRDAADLHRPAGTWSSSAGTDRRDDAGAAAGAPRRDAPRGPSRDGIPPWFAWAATIFVGVPSFGMLAFFQHALFAAAWPFVPGLLTVSLAVGIDSFGVTAGAYWLRSPRGSELRRWGFAFAVLSVLGSTGLMMASIHELAPGREWLGTIPAFIVFGSTKLFTAWQADRAAQRIAKRDHAAELAALMRERDEREAVLLSRIKLLEQRPASRGGDTVPIPIADRTRPVPTARVANIAAPSMAQQADEWIRSEWAAGREPDGKAIEARFGAKDSFGRKRLQALRKRGELPPSERAVTA